MPLNKPNNIPLYVNKKSNHPPRIISNIPQSINRRLSEISYDKESFHKVAPFYQKALDSSSGYKHLLTFSSNIPTQTSNSMSKNRKRDIIWYNPPFSKNVSTNIGRAFLKLLDAEFPKEHVLHKIFNLCNTCSLGNSASSSLRKVRPMLVETFLLNGGLYQMMSLFRFLHIEFEVCVGIFEENVRRCL